MTRDHRPSLHPLRSERGAFDLPAVIVGVVVVGILAVGVLATVFGIIPMAQDNGAKQDASSIRTAEGVAKAKEGHYMDYAGLVSAGYLPPAVLTATAAAPSGNGSGLVQAAATGTYNYTVSADAAGTCFVGVAHSGTGTLFYTSSRAGDPQELTPSTDTTCPTAASTTSMAVAVGGYPARYIAAAPGGLTGSSTSNTSAAFTWSAAAGATGYTVEASVNGGAWATVSSNQAGTSYTATGNAGDRISLRVSSVNAAGTSAPSAAVAVALPTGPNFAAPISWTKTGSTGNWVGVASSSDGTKLVAVTDTAIWRSTNTGETWTKLAGPSGVSSGFAAVASSSDGTHIAAASGYYVYNSADSGATWTRSAALGYAPNSLASSADGTKLIASPYSGYTYVSTNSGATWAAVSANGNTYWGGVSVSADGSTMVAGGGYDNYLHISHDSGTTWTKVYSGSGGNAWGASATSANGQTIYAVQQGRLAVSTNGGSTFAVVDNVISQDFTAVTTSADGTKVLAAISSNVSGATGGLSLYASTDTGKTWSTQTSAGTGTWSGLASSSDGSKLIASAKGTGGFLVTGSYPG